MEVKGLEVFVSKNRLAEIAFSHIKSMHWKGELENENGNLDDLLISSYMQEVQSSVVDLLKTHKDITWEEN